MDHSHSSLPFEIIRLSAWLTALVVLFAPLERLFAVHPHRLFRREILNDLGYYFLSSLFPAFLLSFPIAGLAWAANRFVPEQVLATTGSLPLWARVIAGLVAGEVGVYWGHRWSHEIPFLWRFHSIHHSAEEMDFLVHTRAHPFDMVFVRFCGMVPLYVLGLGGPTNLGGSIVPAVFAMITTVWGFFIHANLRWRFGPLEWLVATPAFHHWHHTRTGPIDRNYSSNFPWLDAIFGSLYLPKHWPKEYGIKAEMPEAIVDQLVYPLLPPPKPVRVERPERVEAVS